ncbi:uncharacterized protein LOC131249056 isoform X2 [Magnolia sinica]|uniref:uncharacterized protein LOC131249056 isoform X2 n=1 Tax=Magnolia sinica TaxID=86752 RepID=UPI0026591321|nr:uncharacterized protein LOC131249056 isoform X2 [Magnolia sinica]
MGTEERTKETEVEPIYKTKVVQFLGRSVPIILQNDNGPCPLIAISNVLLLRNHLNLSLDTSEVSLQKLLSLVAERLIDSNSNVQDKDAGYVQNQQQNIGDAIDLLPRLATGIDVNLHFRKIDDFEFTPERAIFDLLGIELYHGWIVDPQDNDTLDAIGSKSYNTLTGELAALDTRNTEGEGKHIHEEETVDFAAATTAALGVPSPCLSRADVPPSPPSDNLPDPNWSALSTNPEESMCLKVSDSGVLAENFEHPTLNEFQRFTPPDINVLHHSNACSNSDSDGLSSAVISTETAVSLSKIAQSKSSESADCFVSSDKAENIRTDVLAQNQTEAFLFPDRDGSVASYTFKDHLHGPEGDQTMVHTCPNETSLSLDHLKLNANQSNCESTVPHDPAAQNADSDSSDGGALHVDVSEGGASSLDGSEPIYEGEERILDSGHSIYENREPMYEGEMVLAEQADRGAQGDACSAYPKDEVNQQKGKGLLSINAEQGESIRNFLKNNASQLTIYGLFCLQEGLKERELCVFFRNNHFSTMFKYHEELYLLATDQGYINQPDLVWEKLNEVNGDSVFMTGNFKEFKAENQANDSWDEHNAMTSTADYLASIDNSAPEGSTLNSDLQLAIALQQQEFENQPQRQTPHPVQQPHVTGPSRLVTGPQGPRSSNSSSSKPESKTKDKCAVM